MSSLVEPFSYAFMQRALMEVVLLSLVCGVLGVFVVLRGFTYAGESLGHTLVPGAAVAVAAGLPTLPLAFAGALLAVLLIGVLAQRPAIGGETAVGVVFSGAFATGVILLSLRGTSKELDSILFGSILAVTPRELGAAAIATVAALTVVALLGRRFVTVAFDPLFARALSLRPLPLDLALLIALALALTVALQGMGTLLALSMLIAPAATARVLVERVWTMLWAAPMIGLVTGLVGLEVSYHLGVAAGAAIALTAVATFAASAAFAAGLARGREARVASRRPVSGATL